MARIAFRAVGGVMGAQIRANKRKTRRTNPPKISQASSRDVPGGRETKSNGLQNRLGFMVMRRLSMAKPRGINYLLQLRGRATRAGCARAAV